MSTRRREKNATPGPQQIIDTRLGNAAAHCGAGLHPVVGLDNGSSLSHHSVRARKLAACAGVSPMASHTLLKVSTLVMGQLFDRFPFSYE